LFEKKSNDIWKRGEKKERKEMEWNGIKKKDTSV